jgi:D-arabinose 1-dehydrogenase-like Zn-dependent alcohol dehydrogenase
MQSYDVVEWGKPLQKAMRETPKPAGTEVLIKLKYSGVCHSDVHIRDGYFELGGGKRFYMTERGLKLPVTLGHEPYGQVVAAGPDARDVPLGQDRLVCPWTGCGACAKCLTGDDNLCMTPRFLGVARPGGYADHVIVPHPRYLVDASGVDPAFAATLACSGLTTYGAIQRAKPFAVEDWVVVIGAGGLGLQCISILRALGHANVAAVDIDASKLTAARAAGAKEGIDSRDKGALAKLQQMSGGGTQAVIDLVGAAETAILGIASLKKGGRYVVCGLFGGEIPLSLVPLAQRCIAVQGSYVGTVAELKEVVALARSGKLKPIPIETRPFDQAERTLAELKDGKIVGRVVLAVQ